MQFPEDPLSVDDFLARLPEELPSRHFYTLAHTLLDIASVEVETEKFTRIPEWLATLHGTHYPNTQTEVIFDQQRAVYTPLIVRSTVLWQEKDDLKKYVDALNIIDKKVQDRFHMESIGQVHDAKFLTQTKLAHPADLTTLVQEVVDYSGMLQRVYKTIHPI